MVERKNAFLGYKNKKFKKSKNWHFSKGVNPWFWSKNGHFPTFFFLGNIGQENVFYDIVERKRAFLGYKNKKLKKSKNCLYVSGLSICIFGALYVGIFVARANKVECTMSWCLGTNEILASI